MTREFEVKKRTVSESRGSNFISRIPIVLNEKLTNDEKMEKVQSSYLKDQVSFIKDKITLSPKLMKSFFNNSLENIISHVEKIMNVIQDVNIILLVGGYAESQLVQDRIKKKFANYSIIIPQDCNLVVMKGAVLFGHNPMSITARILRFTYCDSIHPLFDPKKHPQKNLYTDKNGVERCSNFFRKLICKNCKSPCNWRNCHNCRFPSIRNTKELPIQGVLYRKRGQYSCWWKLWTSRLIRSVSSSACWREMETPGKICVWYDWDRGISQSGSNTTLNNNIFEEKFAVGVTWNDYFFSKMKCNIMYDEF